MVPLRAVAEALGYEVTWNEEERSITVGERILWIGENEMFSPEFYTLRDGMVHLAVAPVIVDNLTFVPASFFPAQVFEGQLIIGGYWKNRIDDFIVGIASLTAERLSKYSSYIRFDEPGREDFPWYIISPSVALRDVRWLELGWDDANARTATEMFSAGDITPERPFVVSYVHAGTMSNRGISFVDDYGATRYFVVQDSQASFEENAGGWLRFFEFTPGVPMW